MKTYKAEYTDFSTSEFQAEDSSFATFNAYGEESTGKKLVNLFEVDEEGVIVREIIRCGEPNEGKKEAFKRFLGLFPEEGLDLNPEKARAERLE